MPRKRPAEHLCVVQIIGNPTDVIRFFEGAKTGALTPRQASLLRHAELGEGANIIAISRKFP